MATISIPATTQPTYVAPTATSIVTGVCADNSVGAGQLVYFDVTFQLSTNSFTGGYRVAKSTSNQIQSTLIGVAMNSASVGGPIDVAVAGDLNVLSSLGLSVGQGLWLSGLTGGSADTSPPSSNGIYTSFLGIYVGANIFRLAITPNNGLAFGAS